MVKRVRDHGYRGVQRGCFRGSSWALLLLSMAAAACADDADPVKVREAGTDAALPSDGGAGDARTDARVDMDSGDEDGGVVDDAAVDLDGRAEDGSIDVVGDGNVDDGTVPGEIDAGGTGLPGLTAAQARQVGRFGSDLRIDVSAVRGAKTVVALRVELFNGQVSIGGARVIPLSSVIETLTGSSYALLDGTFERFAAVTSARVWLVDTDSDTSTPRDLTIAPQTVAPADAACDDAFLDNRCADGLGCKGAAPKTCQPGVEPTLTRLGYFVDELGPRIVFEGTDPDSDVVGYRAEFFDEDDVAIAINHDSEDTTAKVFEVSGQVPVQTGNTFYARLEPSQVLIDEVASIRVVAVDSGDKASNVLVAGRSEGLTRGIGTTCDPRGFNRCSDGASCSDFGDQHRCALPTEARTSACDGALVLNPSTGLTSVRGALRSSLYEPAVGCSPPEQDKQPDRIVKLVVAQAVSRLVLSTAHPYTGFDSVLYLLDSCSATARLDRCIADQPAPSTDRRAVLELNNLAAGEYFVVVDSFPSAAYEATSDTFELTVSVE